jgi:hypothetical protein
MPSPRPSLVAAAALLLALAAGAGRARADEYLENPNGREGFMFGAAFGGSLYAGRGEYERSPNLGATLSLRFGVSAGPRLLWMFQLDNLTYLLNVEELGQPTRTVTQALAIFTLAGQYYVGPAFWLKAGVGPASISRTEGDGDRERALDSGLGGMASMGGDVKRWRSWVLGFEGVGALGMFGGDMIAYGGVRLGISHY